MKKISEFLPYAVLLVTLSVSFQANAQFIKYKKYLIPVESCGKPKVIISTDYGDFQANQANAGDPNEPQDLVHYLAYSNHFDTRAIIASGQFGFVSQLNQTITRYSVDYPSKFNTSSFAGEYPTPQSLSAVLYQGLGSPQADKKKPDAPNQAVNAIINEAIAASPACPVNVLVWGPMTDVASAMYHIRPTSKRRNIRIIATGSSNKTADLEAWNIVKGFRDAGTTVNPNNIILSDNGSPTDAFRRLHLGHNCGINPVLYDNVGVETIMNSLTDNVSTSNSGLRGILQLTRPYVTDIHCQITNPNYDPNAMNSLRVGDAMTTLYLLDGVLGFNGELKQIIEANDSTDQTGMGQDSVLRKIYDHYMARMNDIYN